MPSAEVLGWFEYYKIEPFGSWRDNYHAALVAQLIAKAFSGKGANIKLSDFMFVDPVTARQNRDAAALASFEAAAKD